MAYWETKYYKRAISDYLSGLDPKNSIVVDVGCGDGRFTDYLLDLGFQRIIATDNHLLPLQSLAQHIRQRQAEDNVLIINCNADQIPIMSESVDVVLAIGVYYYMGKNFENGIIEAYRCLKRNGMLVNSEPDIEGAIYKSLYFESLDDVYENFFQRHFKEEKGETPFKFRLFAKDELIHILDRLGFRVRKHIGLSLMPSILRIKTVRREINVNELDVNENKIWDVLDYLQLKWHLT